MNQERSAACVSRARSIVAAAALVLAGLNLVHAADPEPLSPADLLRLRVVTAAEISPQGDQIAFTVAVPREPTDTPGGSYSELSLVSVRTGAIRPFVTGPTSARSPSWRPDASGVAFLAKRGEDATTQVWMIPADGGEARQVTSSPTDVLSFVWDPTGSSLFYVATTPESARERELKKKGYDFIYYEEEWKHRNLYRIRIAADGAPGSAEQITTGKSVWDVACSPDGTLLAAVVTERNLVDDSYMFKRIELVNVTTRTTTVLVPRPWKLGNVVFNPDGSMLAFAAGLDSSDNQVSQAYTVAVAGGPPRNITPPAFRGHISWVGWSGPAAVLVLTKEGVENTISRIPAGGGSRSVLLSSAATGWVFDEPSLSRDRKHLAFVGNAPAIPGDVFIWREGETGRRLTAVNPWLEDRSLGGQTLVRYTARDGMPLEGLLISPPGANQGKPAPLIVIVHGGPEYHYSNGWLTRYSEPGQVLAGKGYRVFYPNYRASTGYGVAFAREGLGDPAGKEFDDIADGITYLVRSGFADSARIGLGGGSYGGYASAWFATYYTRLVRAVCMFVGISDLISKRGTTDIPMEELYVHSGRPLEAMWELSLQRSPVYWASRSRTATLILGGAADTRVHPSQSMELYRRMKVNGHPAVRLVQYPGEGHGNARQPGRTDLLYRVLVWYDWYVRDLKPLDGPMPPLDISDRYGLSLPEGGIAR